MAEEELSAEDLLAAARGRLSMRDVTSPSSHSASNGGTSSPKSSDRLTMSFNDLNSDYASNSRSPKRSPRRSLQVKDFPRSASRSVSPKPPPKLPLSTNTDSAASPNTSTSNGNAQLDESIRIEEEEEEEEEEEDNNNNNNNEQDHEDEKSHHSNSNLSDDGDKSNYSETEEDDEEEEEDEDDVNNLLQAVRGRMEQQKFMDEVKDLKQQLADKDDEITKLKGQLQMAISTKQSLLIANSELEERHQKDMEMSTRFEEDLRMAGQIAMDIRAEVEKDFINDLAHMAQKLAQSEQNLSEKDDQICKLETQLLQKKIMAERPQCANCSEKAEIIAALQEKVNKLEKVAPRQETSKVKFYRAKLGL